MALSTAAGRMWDLEMSKGHGFVKIEVRFPITTNGWLETMGSGI